METYDQGTIIAVSFDPSKGHEPQKTRPALVLGTDEFNQMSSLTIVAPITSVNNRYPLHVEMKPGNAAQGFICLEQMAALDLTARKCEECGQLDRETMSQVLDIVAAIFGV